VRKLIKFALYTLAAIILTLGIILAILPFIFDPNDFKGEIAEIVRDKTGRDLTIKDDLSLSVFPWLSVETGYVSLSDAPRFGAKPFVEFDQAIFKLKLVDLLSGQINVKQAKLKGLKLNLTTNAEGVKNWENLAHPGSEQSKKQIPIEISNPQFTAEEDEAFQLSTMKIASIALEDAQIAWHSHTSQQHYNIRHLNFHMDRFKFNSAIDFSISAAAGNIPESFLNTAKIKGRLFVEPGFNISKMERFQLRSEFVSHSSPKQPINYELDTAVILDMEQQTMVLLKLKLRCDDLVAHSEISITNLLDNPNVSGPVTISKFNPTLLMEKLGHPLPPTKDPKVLSSLVGKFKFKYNSGQSNLQINKISMQLDDTALKGKASFVHNKQRSVLLDFNANRVNMDRYFPETGIPDEKPHSTTANTNKQTSQAPISKVRKHLSSEPHAIPNDSFPLDAIRDLNLHGIFNIGNVRAKGLKAQGVQLIVKSKNQVIHSNQRIKKFYDGRYKGAMELNFRGKTPIISMNETINNIQLGQLLQDYSGKSRISGTARGTLRLIGRGSTFDEIKSTLNGDIKGSLINGQLQGINIVKITQQAQSILKTKSSQNADANDATHFSKIAFASRIKKGIVHNHSLTAKVDALAIKGHGTINLKNEVVDYKLDAKINENTDGLTDIKIKELAGTNIPIRISGTLSQLKYHLDIKQILKNPKVRKAKKKIIISIDKKFGPGASKFLDKLF